MSAYTKGTALEITSHSPWAQQFWDELIPYKDRVSQRSIISKYGRWTIESGLLSFGLA